MICLWRGLNNPALIELTKEILNSKKILISIPLHLKDFSFLKIFSPHIELNELQFFGDWPAELKISAETEFQKAKANNSYLESFALLDISKVKAGVFTSGTISGKPRLVLYTIDNIKSSISGIRELFNTQRIQNLFCYPQPLHTFGLNLGYFQSVLFNTQIHFSKGAYSHETHKLWLDTLTENTLTLGTPTHFLDLISWVQKNNIKPPKSYSCIIGGANVSRQLWNDVQNILNIESPSIGYGATEASPGITHLGPGIQPLVDGDIGYQLRSIDSLKITNNGLEFSGAALCYAIFDDNKIHFPKSVTLKDKIQVIESTENTSSQKNSLQNNLRFQFCGRIDLIINRGGTKISLEAVENKILELTGYKTMAVGLKDSRLGETLGLIIEAPENTPDLFNKVTQHLVEFFAMKLNPEHFLIHTIPLNNSAKFDRKEGLRFLLKQMNLQFPISIAYIKEFLPHRDSAIWVDHIIESQFRFGKSQVIIKPHANYMSPSGLRPSSAIEFVAQTYGYSVVANDILGLQKADHTSETYIAEISNFVFNQKLFDQVQINDQLTVESKCSHDFGPLKILSGVVKNSSGDQLASVKLKVFVTN